MKRSYFAAAGILLALSFASLVSVEVHDDAVILRRRRLSGVVLELPQTLQSSQATSPRASLRTSSGSRALLDLATPAGAHHARTYRAELAKKHLPPGRLCRRAAQNGTDGAWAPPTSPPGTLVPFDEESIPPAARDLFSRWRVAEYAHLVQSRRQAKYKRQLENKARLAAAEARGKLAEEDESALAWYTKDSEAAIKEKLKEAAEEAEMLAAAKDTLREEVTKLSEELGFPLPPSRTSPLPEDRPSWRHVTVSFLLQYYKHPHSAEGIAERLWGCTHGNLGTGQLDGLTSELLVNVDSRGDAGLWDAITSRFENGSFITAVGSNNLHEVHGYNRLASMARGEVLILMQDDDMPPESCAWARHVVQLTRRWPRLGAIGMRNGDMFFPSEALDEVFRPKNLTREEAEGRGKEYPWQHCREGPKQARNLHRDAATGLPFDFVTVVDMAPLARMFDEGLAEPGECGILQDWELSTRMWLKGWQVGLIRGATGMIFTRAGVGGSHANPLNEALCWHKQPTLIRYDRTSPEVGRRIMRAVLEANEGLETVFDGPPPWEKCCSNDKVRVEAGQVEECRPLPPNPWPEDWPVFGMQRLGGG